MRDVERLIATLQVETLLIESHVQRLSGLAASTLDAEERRQIVDLAKEEADKAEKLKHRVRSLKERQPGGV